MKKKGGGEFQREALYKRTWWKILESCRPDDSTRSDAQSHWGWNHSEEPHHPPTSADKNWVWGRPGRLGRGHSWVLEDRYVLMKGRKVLKSDSSVILYSALELYFIFYFLVSGTHLTVLGDSSWL